MMSAQTPVQGCMSKQATHIGPNGVIDNPKAGHTEEQPYVDGQGLLAGIDPAHRVRQAHVPALPHIHSLKHV